MRVRWLGNACIEIFGDKRILIDPNFLVEPEKEADIVLLTHEHDDHFDKSNYFDYGKNAGLIAPETSLKKFGVNGKSVVPGDEFDDIRVLESNCWNSEESVSYFYKGILHAGDSADFPEVSGVKLVFTACFPDYYDDYVVDFKKLDPGLVIPIHYDPSEDLSDAQGLVDRLSNEGIDSKILELGESVNI
ncbi:MAG: MBL fold metallo-hydrolase [Hadesarchaea archaeon]|nr:MBL fold metallo-hydrolase [Hadesarchaea archaeon]